MKPVVLIVLDGFGVAPPGPGNAISLANPPNINSYLKTYPNTTLLASGDAVGLPRGEVGNTEVGHINLGAGRIVYQDLPRINMSIADGSFYENAAFLKAAEHIKKTKGKLHIIGLIGGGTVHSNIDHLYALLYFAKEQNVSQVFIHAITDGRDSPPRSAVDLITQLEQRIINIGVGKIATVMGRFFAMDRDRRWQRTEQAYHCLTEGKGEKFTTALEAINSSYQKGQTDEFIVPSIITDVKIESGDAVIFFNYRIDRPRQLTKAFVLDDFEHQANISTSFDPYATKYYKTHLQVQQPPDPAFPRGPKIPNIVFVTMTEYEKDLPVHVAYPKESVLMPLGRVIANNNLSQMRMSESEKERFVTYYFSGLIDFPFPNEERHIIPSPKVVTYDLKPEMSAVELSEAVMKHIKENRYAFILVNFANPDMVGHTGNIDATIKAVQTVDVCVGRIVNTAMPLGMTVLITADHGNAERKIDPRTGNISTEHTDNSVPFIVVDKSLLGKYQKLQSGILADVAPTVLHCMGLAPPIDMTGRNLLEEMSGIL